MTNTTERTTFDGNRLGAMLEPATTAYPGTGYTAGGITVATQITGAVTYWMPAQNFVFSGAVLPRGR